MTTMEHSLPVDLAARRAAKAHSENDVAQAERLIEDLAALVDAGLVVVQDRLLGPARYGISSDLGDAG
jgi:hypothetical protein